MESNLDEQSSAEKIAEHFSAISKEYPPIDASKLPDRVRDKISHPNCESEAPRLEEFEVYGLDDYFLIIGIVKVSLAVMLLLSLYFKKLSFF